MDVRRAADRSCTREDGRETWHSFSFGAHYDPSNTGFGPLVALNDERLPPGTGYAPHRHAETEIVTVVLAGRLHHSSDVGEAVLEAGDVQRLTAGTGVEHAEVSADPEGTTRFLQTWVRPAAPGLAPAYQHVPGALSGPSGPLRALDLGAGAEAVLHVGRVPVGGRVALPAAGALHLVVAGGAASISADGDEEELDDGDAVRLPAPGAERTLAATGDHAVAAVAWLVPDPV